jgi:phage baseplate assembly protein W
MIHTTPIPERAFLGVGWAFPPKLDPDGTISEAIYEEDIRQAIRIILGTNPGERVMRPDFGAGLNAFVFEPISTTTMTLIQNQVQTALVDWESRIEVHEVVVQSAPNEAMKLLIDITYRVRVTNAVANLVYPFYLQEGNPA